MASNGYRQPHRQGPPPQQYYYNDQYDQRGYDNGQQNQMYNQQDQAYNKYHKEHYNQQHYHPYDDQSAQHEQWDDRLHQEQYQEQYQEQTSQDQYKKQPRPYEQEAGQQRSYQYDDRYRANGQDRPPIQNGPGRSSMHTVQGRPIPRNDHFSRTFRGNDNYNSGENSIKQSKVRERILQKEPDSPKTSSWDNPFPAFPSKKKQAEPKRPDSRNQRLADPVNRTQSPDVQRPSTSHSNRQQRGEIPVTELQRPSTSHSQRKFEPLNSPLDAPAMPLRTDLLVSRAQTSQSQRNTEPLSDPRYAPEMPSRQDFQGLRSHTSHSQRHIEPVDSPLHPPEMPTHHGPLRSRPQPVFDPGTDANNASSRPLLQRAMTGPAPEQRSNDYFPSDQQYQHNTGTGEAEYREYPPLGLADEQNYRSPPPQHYRTEQEYRDPQQQQINPLGNTPYGSSQSNHRRQSSDQSYQRNYPVDTQDYDSSSYRGVPLTKKISPEVPNFDVIPNTPTEKAETHLGSLRQQGLAYNKPTYQNPVANHTVPQQRPSTDYGNDLTSPLSQFTFDLNSNGTAVQRRRLPQAPAERDQQFGQQESQGPRRPPPLGPGQPMQFPPRGASRPQDFPPSNSNSYPLNKAGQGHPPIRPGLAQVPPPQNPNYEQDRQGYDNDDPSEYDSGYTQDNNHRRPGMPSSQTSHHSDSSRQGYDQRIRPRPEFASQQAPPRPATASAGRPGTTSDHGLRTSSDSYQRNGMQNPDSLPAHPAPFRPGLMQAAPPASRPIPTPPPPPPPPPQPQPQRLMHQRAPSGAKPPAEAEAPVTIRELNLLREDYKNHPNDFALGLKFAKRLVEAAKVLASENGRADPKQTAKNRERYILDAHKIVKRLCSSGYSEAMFYLADCYGQGLLGLETDPKEAFSLYQSAAKLGHAQAAYRVAVCCELGAEEGGGTRRDPLKAVQWYKRAASLGDTPAMYKMGMIQLKGLLSQPKSPREAISWLKRAAERADADNPHALHELGLLYENAQPTDIVIKDEKYALQLFQQAAELGYKYSQFRLGSAYEYGLLGLPIDPRMSIAWYSRAAKQGEHQSEFALSGWYLTGSGQAHPDEQPLLLQSDTEAYLWARKAASSGLAKAEYAMGYYTEVGIGVTSNLEEAKRWYYRAAAQNHPKARERLEDLKKGGQRMQKTRVSRSNIDKHNEGECVVM